MGTSLAGLAGDVASFYNMTQDEAYTKLKSVFSGETETLKEIGVVMTQSALDAYALANGYGKTTQAMSEAEKVALRYAYVQKQLSAATGDFLRTSDSWANQTRLLKLNLEQLGATIGGSLINMLKPLVKSLNVVISKFNHFAQAMSESLGKIFGWTYDTGGVSSDLESGASSASDIAGGIGNAASNAKKLKQQLSGIDELNVLTKDTASSGGTSGTVGGGSAGNLGEWKQAESIVDGVQGKLGTLEKLFKDIKIGDWFAVGQDTSNLVSGIFDFFSDAIEKVEWRTLGEDTGKFVSGIDWYDTITSAIRLAWETGDSITDFFIGLLTEWNEEDLADDIAKGIKKTNWKTVGEEVLNGIFKLDELADLLHIDKLLPQIAGQFTGVSLAIDVWEFLFDFDYEKGWKKVTDWWEKRPKLKEVKIDFSDPIGSLNKFRKDFDKWKESNPLYVSITTKIDNIKSNLSKKWSDARKWWKDRPVLSMISPNIINIKDNLKRVWNTAEKWWKDNVKLSIPKLEFKVTYKKASGIMQKAVVSALGLDGWPSLQFFAGGGFPEDGWFRAKHGEIMGKFDNGKSVVANNMQITEGISAAVYQGNQENNALLREEISLLQRQNELLHALGRAVQRENKEYFYRTGRGLLET